MRRIRRWICCLFLSEQRCALAFSPRAVIAQAPVHISKARPPCTPPTPLFSTPSSSTLSSFSSSCFILSDDDAASVLGESLTGHVRALVTERADARRSGNYSHADRILDQIRTLELPDPHLELALQDGKRQDGGGTMWFLQIALPLHQQQSKQSSLLQLAHAALGWAVARSQQQTHNSSSTTTTFPQHHQKALDLLVLDAKQQLQAWYIIHQSWQQTTEQNGGDGPGTGNPWNAFLSCIRHNTNNQVTAANSTAQVKSWMDVEAHVRGRKAADAAFWFALAGVTDPELFQLLTQICYKEVQRYGRRSSCRPVNLLQICDRLAAAGVRSQLQSDSDQGQLLEQEVQECLKLKQLESDADGGEGARVASESRSVQEPESLLDLHSDRCLLRVWKFSSRQTKQVAFLTSAKQHWEGLDRHSQGPIARYHDTSDADIHQSQNDNDDYVWQNRFSNPNRPLVIDVGCGMGVSLLGLASLPLEGNNKRTEQETFSPILHLPWQDCNFLGVDWSGLAIGYAQGISGRWGLADQCQFVVDRAETLLQSVQQSYPGPVQLCMIQFPTPYRLDATGNGNSQLPKTATDGFMVTPGLLRQIHQLLLPSQGRLLLQSNCEDVALWMHQTACREEIGFQAQSLEHHVGHSGNGEGNHHYIGVELPQRTRQWIAMGGDRATGNI